MAIANLAKPKNVDELCHSVRLSGYYKRFLPLFTDMKKALNKLLRKDTNFQWSTQSQPAFNHLNNECCTKPILKYPNVHKPYTLSTDVTDYAYFSILTQAVDGPDILRPLA